MAYPASTQTLKEALENADREILNLKATCQSQNTVMAAGNVDADFVLNIHRRLRATHALLTTIAGISGIGAYAQEQKGDDQLDIVAEYNTLRGLIDTAADWIEANIPTQDVGGTLYILVATLPAESASVSWREFTPAQTAGLRTNLTAIINGIS